MQAKYLHHICKFCGGDLAACSPFVQAADDSETIVAQLISQFLESAYFNVPVQRSSFSKSLATLIEHNFDGKAAWLAQALGVSKAIVGEWLHEVRPPSLARVVQIAQAAQCPIVDLLAGNTRSLSMHSSRTPRRLNNKPRRTKVEKRYVQDELQKYLAESEPISAAEASRRLGVSQRYLYLWFNSVTKELASRRYMFLAERAKSAVREREVRYRTTAQSLLANGSTLSWARFRAVLGKDANPFTPELRTLWKRVCTEEKNLAELDTNRCR
jgi:DNA-binding transcriptional regulator YdaS (Cro superfamily)